MLICSRRCLHCLPPFSCWQEVLRAQDELTWGSRRCCCCCRLDTAADPFHQDVHDGMRQAPSIGRARRRGRAPRDVLLSAPSLPTSGQRRGSGSRRSPPSPAGSKWCMAAENYTIFNFYGRREQPLDVPQVASSASRREQHRAWDRDGAGGRSPVCDRLRDRVRVVGRVGDGLRCIRCVRATVRSMVCGGTPHESIGGCVRRESVRSIPRHAHGPRARPAVPRMPTTGRVGPPA